MLPAESFTVISEVVADVGVNFHKFAKLSVLDAPLRETFPANVDVPTVDVALKLEAERLFANSAVVPERFPEKDPEVPDMLPEILPEMVPETFEFVSVAPEALIELVKLLA